MNCSIIYYIAYKTGYIQRNLNKKLRSMPEITITSTLAAVSEDDFVEKLKNALEQTELVVIIGGLSADEKRNVMTILSDYFSVHELEVTFNKKVINPNNGKDGYLIRSINKYIAVLPDEPDDVDKMFGSELLKNINITSDTSAVLPEPVIKHTIVFAPEPDESMNRLQKNKSLSVLAWVLIVMGLIVAAAAGSWIYLCYFTDLLG